MGRKPFRKGPPLRKYLASGRVYNWILVATLLLIPLLGQADSDREKFVGSHLMCICGCQQVLTECNHIHCPSSVPMRAELHDKLAAGMTDDQVYAAFVSKFGTKVLAAPPFKGAFNITAWLLSMVALVAGGMALVFYLRRLKSATPKPVPSPVDASKFDKEIEDELDKFTPED
jgi:cytochrome c-type biogenesis protein CcmH/NrfF